MVSLLNNTYLYLEIICLYIKPTYYIGSKIFKTLPCCY